jgi:hypothetical protein
MRSVMKNRMSKTDQNPVAPATPVIPFQVKAKPEIREKLKRIAAENGLSLNDVATMALAAGINMVETKLKEIHEPEAQAA